MEAKQCVADGTKAVRGRRKGRGGVPSIYQAREHSVRVTWQIYLHASRLKRDPIPPQSRWVRPVLHLVHLGVVHQSVPAKESYVID